MNYTSENIVPCNVSIEDNTVYITVGSINFTSDGAFDYILPIEKLSLDEYHKKYRPTARVVRAKKG